MSELGPYEKMTNQEKREFFRNRETKAAMKPTLGTECSKCGHVHMSIVCSCGCDISGELLKPQAKMSQPENELRAALERMRDEAKHEEKVAKEHDDLGQHSWGFKRTAEALRRWTLVLETALASRAPAASEYERGRRDMAEQAAQVRYTVQERECPVPYDPNGNNQDRVSKLVKRTRTLPQEAQDAIRALAATSGTPAPATTPTPEVCKCYKDNDYDFYAAVMTGVASEWTVTEDCPIHRDAQAAAPGPKCSHGVLMREFCQGCEDAP